MSIFSRSIAAAAAGLMLLTGAANAQDRKGWPGQITVGTASQGGVYFVYGNGLATFITERLGIKATGEVTGGPVQNVTLIQQGAHNLGLVTMGPMLEAWNGKSKLAPGLQHRDVRALFPMYETPFHVITLRKSGITSISQLAGKRVSVGPAGGTPGTYWPRILNALGIKANVSNAGAADAASQLKDGLVDAFAFAAGLPTAAFSQVAAEADAVTFGFTPEEHAKIAKAFPDLAPFTIPANVYKGQTGQQASFALWNFAVTNKSLPESLAYEITKLALENNGRMVQIHKAATATLLKNWDKNAFLPYHKGAVRYLTEKGIKVPANLRD